MQDCELCSSPPPPNWALEYVDGGSVALGTREALLTVGNGYLATRGAAPEATADGTNYPGTYLAGCYNRVVSHLDGVPREDESLVNAPNWLPVTFRAGPGTWFAPDTARFEHEHQVLDMRAGAYLRVALVIDEDGRRTRLRQRRLVSMATPHLAVLDTTLTPVNWSGRLELRHALDGRVANTNDPDDAGLTATHLTAVRAGTDGPDRLWLSARTSGSGLTIGLAARAVVSRSGRAVPVPWRTATAGGTVAGEAALVVGVGDEIGLAKTVAVYTSRDRAIYEPVHAARSAVAGAVPAGDLRAAHEAAWLRLWGRLRLTVRHRDAGPLPVTVPLFHLAQTLSPHTPDLDAGVPARGLHGEGYRGHVFWDELFVFPFLTLRLPELTRELLRYRHRRLPQARRLAAAQGEAGALFPWQSASDGRDASPGAVRDAGGWMTDHSGLQQHVNLAVGYAVWRYWETTGDLDFLAAYGAELLIEAARYWAGRATYDPADDRYDLRGVMGPDEFHDGYPDRPGEGVDNCAYVNILAAWLLGRAREAHAVLDARHGAELWRHLHLTAAELRRWDHIERRLRLSFLPGGVLEQFAGYGDLAELDLDACRARHEDLGRLGLVLRREGDSTNRYKVSKQADVLMLLYLFSAEELVEMVGRLGYPFDTRAIPATVDHYLARTVQGSTLSRVVHAWVLARGDRRGSWRLLREALGSDLAGGSGGSTRAGIHLGAMGGALDILQRCYTGLDARGGTLRLDPRLPAEVQRLELAIRYRGRLVELDVGHDEVVVRALPSGLPPVPVAVRDARYEVAPGTEVRIALPP